MNTTSHFLTAIARRNIQQTWCERIVSNPRYTIPTANGRTLYYGWCPEVKHALRVVVLEDGETLHTAMIDTDHDSACAP